MGKIEQGNASIYRLTNGPKHHLFGFHDLIISNKEGDKFLATEANVINRPPLPDEQFGVGYVQDGQYKRIGETCALNYPQGSRLQWLSNTNYFIVNNKVGDSWGSNLYDADNDKLIEVYPSTCHMLSKDGKKAYGLDYARLFRLGGYGYTGIEDAGRGDAVPSESGITVMDMETRQVKLLVSVRQAAECGTSKLTVSGHHYLTHLCLNPSSTRLAFLHRYLMPDGGGMTRLMTIGVDGSGLRCIAQGFLSHYDWKDDNTLYIFGRANSSVDAIRNNPLLSNPVMSGALKLAKKTVKFLLRSRISTFGKTFIEVSDSETPVIKPIAVDVIQEDGHPMTNPANRSWCINDTYPNADGIRTLMLYHFEKDLRIDLGCFKMLFERPDRTLEKTYFEGADLKGIEDVDHLAFARSGLHCDLHPRWSADGRLAFFDSIHEGTRQIYYVDVASIIGV